MKPITIPIIVPSCLTPDSDLLAGISNRIERRNKACHLLGYLHTGRLDEQRERDFVPVSSAMAKRIYTPKAYFSFRQYLESNSIIESDHEWRRTTEQRKGYCKGWRICAGFATDSVVYQLDDKILLRNLCKERARISRNHTEAIRQMERDMSLVALPPEFDHDDFITTLPDDPSPHAQACLRSSILKIEDSESEINNTISQGQWGRYFHKLNNAHKELRKWLTIDGDQTCEVDIANCQPLLMAVILGDQKMIQSCREGRFYEDLMEASPTAMTRKKMKRVALTNVIAKTPKTNVSAKSPKDGIEYWHGTPADVAFKIAFPKAYELYEEYRAKHGDLAMIRALQGLESKIVHEHALPIAQNQSHQVISIHDGMLTRTSSAESVAGTLEAAFRSETGESCKVSVD